MIACINEGETMGVVTDIMFKEENGFFKVPADFVRGFNLVPIQNGKLNLVFCSRHRMRQYLKQYKFKPIGPNTKILGIKKAK